MVNLSVVRSHYDDVRMKDECVIGSLSSRTNTNDLPFYFMINVRVPKNCVLVKMGHHFFGKVILSQKSSLCRNKFAVT